MGRGAARLRRLVPGRYQSRVVFGDEFGVTADEALLLALDRLFGRGCAKLV